MANTHGGARAGAGRPKDSKSARSRFQAAQARKEEALAKLRELDLRRRERELVPFADVVADWQAALSILRQRLLSIPNRVGAEHGPAAAETAKRLIWEALNELADPSGVPPQARAES